LPLWVKLADRIGQVPAWAVGMLVAVLAFIWAYFLPHSTHPAWGYAVVCALSGMALGADLTLPSALLAGLIDEQSKQAKNGNPTIQGGTYFGLWNCLSKLNLALAAGVALPLLQVFGYVSQANPSAGHVSLNLPALAAGSTGLQALVVAYAVVPCVLKLLALGVLWASPLRAKKQSSSGSLQYWSHQ
jgi:Na+/melibiose symporter-like transporter